jgi:transcriptional regulator with XRE-family HTH domain
VCNTLPPPAGRYSLGSGAVMARQQKIRHDDVVRLFGQRLREVRRSRGLTQADLAERAEVTVGYVSRLESGAGGAVGLDLLARLAASLGTTVAELVPDAVNPTDPDAVVKARVRELADALARSADRDTLLLAAQLLARLSRADRQPAK